MDNVVENIIAITSNDIPTTFKTLLFLLNPISIKNMIPRYKKKNNTNIPKRISMSTPFI